MGDKYINRAKKLEQSADALKKKINKPKNYEERLFGKLFSAGRNYELGQDLYHAEALYKEANRYIDYVGENSKKALSKKLSSPGKQRKNVREALTGVTPLFKKRFKRKVFATLSVIFLLSALVFTSLSLTGYSIFELTQDNSRFMGTIFFICGLVFAFLYFKKRKN